MVTQRSYLLYDQRRSYLRLVNYHYSKHSFMVRCVLAWSSAGRYVEQCQVDSTPGANNARLERARAYMMQTSYSYCGVVQVKMELYLMIDKVREVDAGAYSCIAGLILNQQNVTQTVNVTAGTYDWVITVNRVWKSMDIIVRTIKHFLVYVQGLIVNLLSLLQCFYRLLCIYFQTCSKLPTISFQYPLPSFSPRLMVI